jgi:hypothetical protein
LQEEGDGLGESGRDRPAADLQRPGKGTMSPDERAELAERARAECLRIALEAYEDAGLQGLCAEGRWEAAIDAIRALDLTGLIEGPPRSGRPSRRR